MPSEARARWTWRVALRLWFYNNVKRHWHNLLYSLSPPGRASKRKHGVVFPLSGAITRADWEWAVEVCDLPEVRAGIPEEPHHAE